MSRERVFTDRTEKIARTYTYVPDETEARGVHGSGLEGVPYDGPGLGGDQEGVTGSHDRQGYLCTRRGGRVGDSGDDSGWCVIGGWVLL